MEKFIKYFEDGLSIFRHGDGTYTIFTIPTQHFKVKSLEELTVERFELEIENQEKNELLERELFEAIN